MNKTDKSCTRAFLLIFAVAFGAVSAQAQSSSPTVDSLASSLAALTARVAKLEGQIAAADLVGTYSVVGFQMELDVAGGGPLVSSYVFTGTAVLNADGTGSVTLAPPTGNTLSIGAKSAVSPFMPGNGGGAQISGTWTYANGSVTFSGGIPSLAVAAGGRILVTANSNPNDGTAVLGIFTRLQ